MIESLLTVLLVPLLSLAAYADIRAPTSEGADSSSTAATTPAIDDWPERWLGNYYLDPTIALGVDHPGEGINYFGYEPFSTGRLLRGTLCLVDPYDDTIANDRWIIDLCPGSTTTCPD